MEGNIAATYTLIHRFLKQQSQNKAAEAVKKAAKNIVDLGDVVAYQGPPLEDIVEEWKTRQHPTPKHSDPSSKESESSDVSSSDSEESSDSDSNAEDTPSSESEHDDSSDGSDESDKETEDVRPPQKGVERDTSATLSSAGENARALTTQVIEEQPTKKKGSTTDSDSSDSDDSDSDGHAHDAEKSSGSGASSDSESSEENESEETEKVPPDTTKTTENEESSSSESDSDSEDESDSEPTQKKDAQAAKKRKTSENGPAVTTAVASRSHQTTRPLHNENPPTKVIERFQRIKFQNMPPELLLDNGYEARGGKTSDYGQRAHHDLVVTRGAGFRKEKNKKKRGSYRGGEITMENHSIRFDF